MTYREALLHWSIVWYINLQVKLSIGISFAALLRELIPNSVMLPIKMESLLQEIRLVQLVSILVVSYINSGLSGLFLKAGGMGR